MPFKGDPAGRPWVEKVSRTLELIIPFKNSLATLMAWWEENWDKLDVWAEAVNKKIQVVNDKEDGIMASTDKAKLDGIDTGANKYTLPVATSSILGGVIPKKLGWAIKYDSASGDLEIPLEFPQVSTVQQLGLTPPTTVEAILLAMGPWSQFKTTSVDTRIITNLPISNAFGVLKIFKGPTVEHCDISYSSNNISSNNKYTCGYNKSTNKISGWTILSTNLDLDKKADVAGTTFKGYVDIEAPYTFRGANNYGFQLKKADGVAEYFAFMDINDVIHIGYADRSPLIIDSHNVSFVGGFTTNGTIVANGNVEMNAPYSFIIGNNNGYKFKKVDGTTAYSLFIDQQNKIHIGYENSSPVLIDSKNVEFLGGFIANEKCIFKEETIFQNKVESAMGFKSTYSDLVTYKGTRKGVYASDVNIGLTDESANWLLRCDDATKNLYDGKGSGDLILTTGNTGVVRDILLDATLFPGQSATLLHPITNYDLIYVYSGDNSDRSGTVFLPEDILYGVGQNGLFQISYSDTDEAVSSECDHDTTYFKMDTDSRITCRYIFIDRRYIPPEIAIVPCEIKIVGIKFKIGTN